MARWNYWNREETADLVAVWSEPEIQRDFNSMVRNKSIWENIARRINEASKHRKEADPDWTSAEKDWEQCKSKLHNLTSKYKITKKQNKPSGTGRADCPFFAELDAVLGQRHDINPISFSDSLSDVCAEMEAEGKY